MRHFIITTGLAALLTCAVQAQNTNVAFTPGKLAVLRGGDGIITIVTGRQHPIFIDEYDPAISNQSAPLMSVELPTNGNNGIFMNAHAGSEGQGMTRSADRQSLVVSGYCGNLNSISGTPSSATNAANPEGYPRGFGLIDAYTNFNVTYASTEWFGIPPGVTQDNPRGIATDGSNDFWGCGTVAGNQSGGIVSETGTLFWNNLESPDPGAIQNQVDSAYFLRIINDTLYMVCLSETGGAQFNGLYTFQTYFHTPDPLPWIASDPSQGDSLTTNLFLNAGTTFANLKSFDMNPTWTVAYLADTTYGIIKFVNAGGGSWIQSYLFNSNNIGSGIGHKSVNPKGATGCFGIAVDFSGVNPVIYATTMDEGDGANTCSNRLISIVDTGTAPGATNVLATTLAVAHGISEVFRGVDFTPDLAPLIVSQPAGSSILTNQTFTFNVGLQSVYPLSYQWLDNGTILTDGANLAGSSTASLTIDSSQVTNSGNYTVIVTNAFGAVTSLVANLVVSTTNIPPSITNGVQYVTNFVANNQAFSASPSGTVPFTYQWYFGNTQLVDDGVKYFGSTGPTLYITNLAITDSGSYYLTVSNQATTGLSNLMAILTVQYVVPSIGAGGQPLAVTMLQGQTTTLSVASSGTPPLSYQWYQVEGKNTNALNTAGEFSGTQTSTLTITDATHVDATNYLCIVTNLGGSTTSSEALVTVIVPPALSYVAYSNQVYLQNFDSLPDPGSAAVNTIGGGGPTLIGSTTYDPANPFDFAFPLYANITDGPSGGLALSNTMAGWYGECDGDAQGAQLGASDGGTTTGGIYSFGPLAGSGEGDDKNRALGLIATSTSGGTHFGLKLINETTGNLDYISLEYVGEFWKTGSKPKIMECSYAIDSTGNASTLNSAEILASSNNLLSNMCFSFPTAGVVGPTNGTLAINQTNLLTNNVPLSVPWTPGSALWLIWSINDPAGSGQGYGIDNLQFAASGTGDITLLPQVAPFSVGSIVYSSATGLTLGFTNVPGASAEFRVWTTTNVSTPFDQWVNLGNPTETSAGNYQFIDAQAKTNSQRFYTVTSP